MGEVVEEEDGIENIGEAQHKQKLSVAKIISKGNL